MSLRWCLVFSGLVLGCDDGDTSPTPEAEVEVIDTDTADGVDEVADTVETPDTVEVEVEETIDTTPDSEDTDTEDTAEPIDGCGDGCTYGFVCVDGTCVCDPTPVSYATDIAPRFATGCGPGCHVYSNAASGSSGLNLALVHSYKDLVGVTAEQCRDGRVRVVPGDPAASYLMQKMLGQQMCGDGVRMPKGRQAWSVTDMAMVGRWICQGALNE